MGRRQSSQSRWTGNPSEARWRQQLLTTLTHNRYLVEVPGLGWAHDVRGIQYAVTQNEANTDTCVVSGRRRGSSVLAGERKGSSSHSGEWRGSGVLSGAREKATAVSCTWAALGQRARENTETVAKQPSAGLDMIAYAGRRRAPITVITKGAQ